MSVRVGVFEHLRQIGFMGSPVTDEARARGPVPLLIVFVLSIFFSLPSGDSLGRLHPLLRQTGLGFQLLMILPPLFLT